MQLLYLFVHFGYPSGINKYEDASTTCTEEPFIEHKYAEKIKIIAIALEILLKAPAKLGLFDNSLVYFAWRETWLFNTVLGLVGNDLIWGFQSRIHCMTFCDMRLIDILEDLTFETLSRRDCRMVSSHWKVLNEKKEVP